MSSVTPRYLTESEKGICCPSIFICFLSSYFLRVNLDLVNRSTTVLLALCVYLFVIVVYYKTPSSSFLLLASIRVYCVF